MKNEPFIIEQPLVIMFKQKDEVICHIHPSKEDNYQMYGMLICDLVRHTANAFKVTEDAIWEWVELERNKPTTKITEAN